MSYRLYRLDSTLTLTHTHTHTHTMTRKYWLHSFAHHTPTCPTCDSKYFGENLQPETDCLQTRGAADHSDG